MNSNAKYVIGALGIFIAGGIFATAIISTLHPSTTEATLKEDTYKYSGVDTEITTTSPAAQTTVAAQTVEDPDTGYFVDAHVKGNPWMEGDLTIQEVEFIISNKGNDVITEWTGNIEFDTAVEDINSWNDTFTRNGNKVSITPVEWNKEIKPGDTKTINFHLKTRAAAKVTGATVTSNLGDFALSAPAKVTLPEPVQPDNTTNGGETPVAKHGQLRVEGTKIVDESGSPVLLQGVSTHGIAWFPAFVNKEAFRTLRDSMGVNTVRLALYSSENEGYNTSLHQKVEEGVNYAKELGMYVIIDWHILGNGNPNTDKEKAKAFFNEMTAKFKDYNNVIYEICNEPNGNVSWTNDIKPYAEEMIPLIRQNDDNAIIIVGTPTWSQDVDIVAQDPIKNQSNIVYALHFYAATHRQELRNKLTTAINAGLPVFVSEFGISEASGNGGIDEGEATVWVNYLRQNGIGYVCWALSNKDEACSLIKSNCGKVYGWTDEDLTQEGLWLKKTYTSGQ